MNLATIVAMMLTLSALADGTEMQEDKSANVPEQQADPGLGKALLRKAIERVAHRQKGIRCLCEMYFRNVTFLTTRYPRVICGISVTQVESFALNFFW